MRLEEKELIEDSGVSMHMLSSKDLNSAELEIVKKSGEGCCSQRRSAHTKKGEATVYVKEMELFVTVTASRRDTGRSLTRKILRRLRIFLRVDQWSETTTHQKKGRRIKSSTEVHTDRCPWFIEQFFQLHYTYFSDISIAGSSDSYIASRIIKN